MSATKLFLFATEAEARAFVAGVEWVNDSAIEFDGSGPIDDQTIAATAGLKGPGWCAVFVDEDYGEDDDEVRDLRTERSTAIAAAMMPGVS